MRETITARLATGPSLLSMHCQTWVDACVNALAALPSDQMERLRAAVDNDDNFWPEPDDWMAVYRPYRVQNGVLIIPIKGVLVNGLPYALGGWATGYPYIARALGRGLADPEVRGIAFDMNTPGGDVSGNFDLVDSIYAARGEKPMRAFAADYAYSAGYSIASAADKIIVNRTGGVGSIGVVLWHADYSKMMEKVGIAMTPIFAGKHKVDGNPYQELSPEVRERLQARIDSLYAIFTETVARNRGMDEQAVRDTEALTFSAEEAIQNGLADAVGSFDESVAAFAQELSDNDGGYTMSTKDDANQVEAVNAAALAGAKAEGVKEGASAERTRIKAICECDEAKNRVAASFNLALNTELSVDQAKALLMTLPEDTKADAAAPAPAPTPFEKAMAGDNPNLGAGHDDKGEKASDADLILRDHAVFAGAAKK